MASVFGKTQLCQRAIFSAIFTKNWKLLSLLLRQNEAICRCIFAKNKVLLLELARRCPDVRLMERCVSTCGGDACTMRLFSELAFQYVINTPHVPLQQCSLLRAIVRNVRPRDLVLTKVRLEKHVTFVFFPQFCLPLRMPVDLRLFLCCLLRACGASNPRVLKIEPGYPRDCYLLCFFHQIISSVPSLQHLCRLHIRQSITSLDTISTLPLPKRLKRYVGAIRMGPL